MEEPSVLDYLKSKLFPWRYDRLEIPDQPPEQPDERSVETTAASSAPRLQAQPAPAIFGQAAHRRIALPGRSLAALVCTLLAQISLIPSPERSWFVGAILLILSLLFLAWAVVAGEIRLAAFSEFERVQPLSFNPTHLAIGGLLALSVLIIFPVTYITGRELRFNLLNILVLAAAVAFLASGFWVSDRPLRARLMEKLKQIGPPPWQVIIQPAALIGIAAVLLAGFFRFYRLADVPPEMNSDHAEKFLDVLRVLSGQTLIFFPSNGGREALQFYLAAGLHRIFGLPLDFMNLKLVTASVGFLALPFIYLSGKEIANRKVGLLAFLLAASAYWPNVVSRVGLRLPFYIFFTAALFYFLARGLRRNSRNDFILAGIFLGLSFYGYSADRILPLLVLAAAGLFLIHRQPADRRTSVMTGLTALIAVSFVVFIPLLSYILSEPDLFFQRTFTRMADWERPISDPVLLIFLQNTGRALAMFSWDAGVVWPISIPGYPALGIVAGGLFYLGVGLVFLRYLRERNWLDLFLLTSIPLLLLPSILALAFPEENPNLYRTGGAVVPVFLLGGLALDAVTTAVQKKAGGKAGNWLALGLAFLLIGFHAFQEYSLVFDRYYKSYRLSAWNSSEMGQIARDFIDMHQAPDNVWVLGFPNWVDTRLVANNAGFPGRDYELKIEQIPATKDHIGPKLFFLNPQDFEGLAALKQTYPEGWMQEVVSRVETKDFILYYVLPQGENGTLQRDNSD